MKFIKLMSLILPLSLFSCSGNCKMSDTQEKKDIDVNVMSFNIRYDNPDDAPNNWDNRKDDVATCIKFYDVDILGTQEVLHNQLEDLKNSLPEYSTIGVGRLDGKEKGEYSAIFYKKDRFEVLSSGYFWLSETPNVAGSCGWDGACERIATWGKFKDKETSKEFLMLNTHLDHVGKEARQNGVSLIIDSLYSIAKDLPVIVTGDFNATPESDVVKHMLSKDNKIELLNTGDIADVKYGLSGSFHDFGKISYDEMPLIDYVFVSKGISVSRYGVLNCYNGRVYLSDHCPILTTIQLE